MPASVALEFVKATLVPLLFGNPTCLSKGPARLLNAK